MSIKIHGYLFRPSKGAEGLNVWRVYGTRQTFNYPDGRVAPVPASWELVTEFKLKRARGKIGFPDFALDATDGDSWQFYNLVPLADDGSEIWHEDNELTLPHNLPDEFEPPFDVPSWLLWNMESKGVVARGQLRD